jgi:hypothetical protein
MAESIDESSPLQAVADHKLIQGAMAHDGFGQGAVVESNLRLRGAIREAKEAIERGSESVDRLTRRLIRLTWGLIVLTSILALLAIPPALETVKKLGWF